MINSLHALVYTLPWTLKFLAAFSTTMESLPRKVLDFGLQMPTGPSSGVVASLYTFGLLKIGLPRNKFWLKFVLLVWRCQCGHSVVVLL